MNILLIAGHGAGDPGATAVHNGKVYREAEETRELASAVFSELSEKYAVDVALYAFDRNAYNDVTNGKLPSSAFAQYDYVLELHFNACTASPEDAKRKGYEVYVTTSEQGVGVELQIGQRLAALGFPNRGVKRKDFAVIKTVKKAGVSAALLEVCFIDDADDWETYQQNKRETARAIAEGIAAGFSLTERPRTDRQIVQHAAKLADATMDYLEDYKYGKDLLAKLATAVKK